jgi:hypothetical protein
MGWRSLNECPHKMTNFCKVSDSCIRPCNQNNEYCTKVRNYDFNFEVSGESEGEPTLTITFKSRSGDGIYSCEIPGINLKFLDMYRERPTTLGPQYYIHPFSELRIPLKGEPGSVLYSARPLMKRMTKKELGELGYEVL